MATPLAAFPRRANRLYAADLLGAGLGCAAAVGALTWLDGAAAVAACDGIFLAGGALYAAPGRLALGLALAALVCIPRIRSCREY